MRSAESDDKANFDFLKILKCDIKRYIDKEIFSILDVIGAIFSEECLQYLIVFRLSQKIIRIRFPFIRMPLKFLIVTILYRTFSILLGIHINIHANIREGFYIGHPGAIFIGRTIIGANCNISQEVTIGEGKADEQFGVPTLGDHVYIGPGAKLFGNISIGNNVSIGANSVVSKTVPDGAIMVGNPGRIVGYQAINGKIQNTMPKKYLGILTLIARK